ncbi:hypothetical protein [Treponema sp. R6D11]
MRKQMQTMEETLEQALLMQYRQSQKYTSLLKNAVGKGFDKIGEMFEEFHREVLNLNNVMGESLDYLGNIFSIQRMGLNDEQYRTKIKVTLPSSNSGTIPEILFFGVMKSGDMNPWLIEEPSVHAVVLYTPNGRQLSKGEFNGQQVAGRSAVVGSQCLLSEYPSDTGKILGFNDGTGWLIEADEFWNNAPTEPPIPPQQTGSLVITVYKSDGTVTTSATVVVNGITQTSSANGVYTFNDLPVGSVSWSVARADHIGQQGTATITANTTATLTVNLQAVPPSVVYDYISFNLAQHIPDHNFRITVGGTQGTVGQTQFLVLRQSTPTSWSFVDLSGVYRDTSGSFISTGNMPVPIPLSRKTGTVAITVYKPDGTVSADATVVVNGNAPSSSNNGVYTFNNVDVGSHNWSVVRAEHYTQTGTLNVVLDTTTALRVDLVLVPVQYIITFTFNPAWNGNAFVITVDGVAGSVGQTVFTVTGTGTRSWSFASNQQYINNQNGSVNVTANVSVQISIVDTTPTTGTLVISVYDPSNQLTSGWNLEIGGINHSAPDPAAVLTISGLTAGNRQGTLTKQGYDTQVFNFTITANQTTTLSKTLVATLTTGTFRLMGVYNQTGGTRVTSWDLIIDGNYITSDQGTDGGQFPVVVQSLSAGNHTIEVRAPGFDIYNNPYVYINVGQTTDLSVYMAPYVLLYPPWSDSWSANLGIPITLVDNNGNENTTTPNGWLDQLYFGAISPVFVGFYSGQFTSSTSGDMSASNPQPGILWRPRIWQGPPRRANQGEFVVQFVIWTIGNTTDALSIDWGIGYDDGTYSTILTQVATDFQNDGTMREVSLTVPSNQHSLNGKRIRAMRIRPVGVSVSAGSRAVQIFIFDCWWNGSNFPY